MTALFMLYIAVHALIVPSWRRGRPGRARSREAVAARAEVVPFILLMLVTLGGLYFGWVTTTEAAAIGCVFSILLGPRWAI